MTRRARRGEPSRDHTSHHDDALERLAVELGGEEVISPHVRASEAAPALGRLAAAGPRASEAPSEYTLLFESIREGYLCHYATPRLLDEADPDLLLLAGDFLYALGLERLAARGDLDAIRELGELISLSAQLHARGDLEPLAPLWLAVATAVASGAGGDHEAAKRALRAGDPGAGARLDAAASAAAAAAGAGDAFAEAAEAIGFAAEHPPDRG